MFRKLVISCAVGCASSMSAASHSTTSEESVLTIKDELAIAHTNPLVNELLHREVAVHFIAHQPVHTCEEATVFVPSRKDLFKPKSLLLRGKNGIYLVVVEENKRLDLNLVKSLLGEKKLSFVNDLSEFDLEQGAVGPFAAVGHQIQVLFDKAINDCVDVEVHPNRNDQTIVLKVSAMLGYLLDYQVPISFASL